MQPRSLPILSIIAFLIPASAFAAPVKNLDTEYEQVRAIALRDPKVQAAYQKADQPLAEKIVEIDPALKGYVRGQSKPAPNKNSGTHASVKPKPFVPPSKSKTPTVHTHTIATGDTLSTIAAKYRITTAQLKAANPGVDEKHLQVTEKLIIPSGH